MRIPTWLWFQLFGLAVVIVLATLLVALRVSDDALLFGRLDDLQGQQLSDLPRAVQSAVAHHYNRSAGSASERLLYRPNCDASTVADRPVTTTAAHNVSVLHAPDLVVVAGAWRRPNGSLSRAFENRVVDGMATALLLGARRVLFTGALNDGFDSMAYAKQIPQPAEVFARSSHAWSVAARSSSPQWRNSAQVLHKALHLCGSLEGNGTLGQVLTTCPSKYRLWQCNDWPTLHAENVSRTTRENGEQAAQFLQASLIHDFVQNPVAVCPTSVVASVVIVTSPYHTNRAKKLFRREIHRALGSSMKVNCYVSTTAKGVETKKGEDSVRHDDKGELTSVVVPLEVLVTAMPSAEDEAELLLPPAEYWIEMSTLSPKLERMTFLPRPLRLWVHSVYITYRNWVSHTRASLLSLKEISGLRELGAFAVAINRGHLRFLDVLLDRD